MSVTTAIRSCSVCGVSIEDRRPQTTTCSDGCRQAKSRKAPFEPGHCRGCGHRLTVGRELRWHCSRACALEPATAPKLDIPITASGCGCGHDAAILDPDGQRVCLACGRPKGPSPKPNGFNDMVGYMITDGDGQYRRVQRRLSYSHLDHLRTRMVAR